MYCIQHSVAKKKIQIIQLCFSIFGFSLNTDRVFYIYLYLQTNTAKSPLFLSREITLYNIVYTTDGTAKL